MTTAEMVNGALLVNVVLSAPREHPPVIAQRGTRVSSARSERAHDRRSPHLTSLCRTRLDRLLSIERCSYRAHRVPRRRGARADSQPADTEAPPTTTAWSLVPTIVTPPGYRKTHAPSGLIVKPSNRSSGETKSIVGYSTTCERKPGNGRSATTTLRFLSARFTARTLTAA